MARTASFLVLGADVTSVQGLCEALTKDGCHVVGMSFVGLMSYWRNLIGKGASFRECDDRLILVPPSYGTRLQLLTRAYLPAVITQCFKSLAREKPNDTWLILTNPIAERWTREVPSDRLIYWNYDDYSLYDPDRAAPNSNLGRQFVGSRTLCPVCFSRSAYSRVFLNNLQPRPPNSCISLTQCELTGLFIRLGGT